MELNEGPCFLPFLFLIYCALLKRDREGVRLLQIVQQIARPDHYLRIRIRRRIVGYPNIELFEADESRRHSRRRSSER